MKTKHTILTRALVTGLSFAPALTQAHPGHSVLDASAGMPHSGHEVEYLAFVGLIAVGFALSLRAYLKGRR